MTVILHGGESRDFRLKNGGFLTNPHDTGKTLFDISINTDQIGMVLKQIPREKESNMSIFSDFQTKTWLKSY